MENVSRRRGKNTNVITKKFLIIHIRWYLGARMPTWLIASLLAFISISNIHNQREWDNHFSWYFEFNDGKAQFTLELPEQAYHSLLLCLK
jgi:hypothetical protein